MALFDQFSIEFSLIRNELAKKISAVSSPFNQNMLGACIHQNIRSSLCNYQCCSVNIRCYPMLFISTKKTASHFFPPFASSVVCLWFFSLFSFQFSGYCYCIHTHKNWHRTGRTRNRLLFIWPSLSDDWLDLYSIIFALSFDVFLSICCVFAE